MSRPLRVPGWDQPSEQDPDYDQAITDDDYDGEPVDIDPWDLADAAYENRRDDDIADDLYDPQLENF